jgi:hypothetical protein
VSAQFKRYECRYYHGGKWWSVEIMAPDWADAEARVAKLGSLQLQGEIVAQFGPHYGWLARLIVWIRNAFKPTSPHD